jgi:23S rRNA (cytidine1920-2'-O)/16S rRNA (cytidine1409-2'-O)-methyltransferase
MKAKKVRLLELIRSLYDEYDKEKLFSLILAGKVRVSGNVIRDPKLLVREDVDVKVDSEKRFVSRGGEKLEHAILEWNMDVKGKVFIDCGSSTGGFTDCLLSHGAKLVYAIDVGYNQLAYKLRIDPRVRVCEKTNIMDCIPSMFDHEPDAAVADLSFRSVTHASSVILGLVKPGSFCIALIKPQFEWDKPDEDFNGVVPDSEVFNIGCSVILGLAKEGVKTDDILVSPIRGREGNTELLFRLVRSSQADTDFACAKLGRLLGNNR